MPVLRGKEGALRGREISVETDLTIGRSDVDIVVDDPEISRRHATVRTTNRGLEITDLASTNGTFVNGQRISEPTALSSGDLIKIGGSTLEVEGDWRRAETLATPVAVPGDTHSAEGLPSAELKQPTDEAAEGGSTTEPLPAGAVRSRTERWSAAKWLVAAVVLAVVAGTAYFFLTREDSQDDFAMQAESICLSAQRRTEGVRISHDASRTEVRRLVDARRDALGRLQDLRAPQDDAKTFKGFAVAMSKTNDLLAQLGRALGGKSRQNEAQVRDEALAAKAREARAARAAGLRICAGL